MKTFNKDHLVTFVFLGILRRTLVDFYGYLDRRDSFDVFDVDHNGVLDAEEIRYVLEGVLRGKNASAVIGTTVGGVGDDELVSPRFEEPGCGWKGLLTPFQITAYMNRILDKADVDHDHLIDFEEYKDVVAELGKIVGERRAAQERAGKVL